MVRPHPPLAAIAAAQSPTATGKTAFLSLRSGQALALAVTELVIASSGTQHGMTQPVIATSERRLRARKQSPTATGETAFLSLRSGQALALAVTALSHGFALR
jgi:hypothetical protein